MLWKLWTEGAIQSELEKPQFLNEPVITEVLLWTIIKLYCVVRNNVSGGIIMAQFTTEELSEAHRALLSTLYKCEKIDAAKLGKSQQTLLERRIAALKIALTLIKREQDPKV